MNVRELHRILLFAAVSLTVSCTFPGTRTAPPSASSTPAIRNHHHHSHSKAARSSSSPTAKNDRHKSKSGASAPSSASMTKRAPRYRVMGRNGNKVFEDTLTGKIWTMRPVVYDASQSLARLACQSSKLAGHHWELPLAKDFIKLTDSKEDLAISRHAPFRKNYDKYGPFWTRTRVANSRKYYVVGFDNSKRYASVNADIGKYTAVCVQR